MTESAPSTTPRLRLDFLDGLRALAALAVVLLHAYQIYGLGLFDDILLHDLTLSALGRTIVATYSLTRFGHYAVEIFIVISGFSLMIPLARAADARLSSGALNFFWRRARRILPPYYAAVGLALLLIVVVPGMGQPSRVYWDLALPALYDGPIVSHLLLFHNMRQDWLLKINPPLWSIAVEWQIYFLFPLLLVIWRRLGALATYVLVAALSFGQISLGWFTYPFSDSWFLLLFTAGMIGAGIAFSPRSAERWMRERLPWWTLALGFLLLFGGFDVIANFIGMSQHTGWIKDCILGLVVTCLLVALTKAHLARREQPGLALSALSWRPLVAIGHFSYSIYLIHAPVLALAALLPRALGLPLDISSLIMIVVALPLAVVAAYPFFLAFERPFMSGGSRSSRRHGSGAGVSLAGMIQSKRDT